jgi:hypothetical protein
VRSPPRVLVAAAWLVLGVCTVLAVLGAFRTGITTDEPIHVMRLRNYFDNGWYALDWDYDGAGPGSDGTNTFVYAPVAMLLLHAWSVLFGVEGWGQVSTSPHAYDIRHLGVVVIGLVGLAAVAGLGRALLRSWGWGVVAAAVCAAIPMWTGHEMFNVKDIPVATGCTLASLGLVLFVRHEPASRRLAVGRALALVSGLILAMGTRPGMWSGLFAALAVTVVGVWLAADGRRRAIRTIAGIAACCAVAGVALIAIYPNLFGQPLTALPRTTENSSSFRDGLATNRLYVPAHLVSEVPTLLLFFVLTGLAVGGLFVATRWRTEPVQAARIGIVGIQAAALPVVAIMMGADLYHGLRQLLFAAPASAVLGAFGIAWWLHRPKPRTVLVTVAATAGLLLPMIDQITLQPYETSYVNLATDVVNSTLAPADRPAADFWRVSIPELIQDQPLDRQLLCKSMVGKLRGRSYRFANGGEYSTIRSLDCREETNGPLAPEHLPVPVSENSLEFDAVFDKVTPPNCRELNRVTRWRHGFTAVLTILARCTSDPPVMPIEGVHADSAALGRAQIRDLFRYAVDGWERWPTRYALAGTAPDAMIAFRAGGECRVYGCKLRITGSGPGDLLASVDGVRTRILREPDAFLVPISAAQASRAHGVWITLTRSSGETLGVTMTGLSEEELDENHLKPTEGHQ